MTYIGEQEHHIYYRFSVPRFLFEGLSRRKKEMCINFRCIKLFLSESETAECNFFSLFLSRCMKAVEVFFWKGVKSNLPKSVFFHLRKALPILIAKY